MRKYCTQEEWAMYSHLQRLAFPERAKRYAAKYYQKNKGHSAAYHKDWISKNREHNREYQRGVRVKNPEKVKSYDRKRQPAKTIYMRTKRNQDINFRLAGALRGRLVQCLKAEKSTSALRLLGCSIASFKVYLESKFETGMSWENYGKFGWHIDHIMPCAIFDLTKPEHQKRCFHFSNLQPMWAVENHRKGGRATADQFNLL